MITSKGFLVRNKFTFTFGMLRKNASSFFLFALLVSLVVYIQSFSHQAISFPASTSIYPTMLSATTGTFEARGGSPLFKTKYTISLDLAKEIAVAARVEAERNGWNVVISILDDGANLVYLERMDGTQIGSIQVAQDKGATAVRFKRSTKLLEDAINTNGKQNMLKMTGALPVEGGLPLYVNGDIIGGIGISGVISSQDGMIAAAGVERLNALVAGLK